MNFNYSASALTKKGKLLRPPHFKLNKFPYESIIVKSQTVLLKCIAQCYTKSTLIAQYCCVLTGITTCRQ